MFPCVVDDKKVVLFKNVDSSVRTWRCVGRPVSNKETRGLLQRLARRNLDCSFMNERYHASLLCSIL